MNCLGKVAEMFFEWTFGILSKLVYLKTLIIVTHINVYTTYYYYRFYIGIGSGLIRYLSGNTLFG